MFQLQLGIHPCPAFEIRSAKELPFLRVGCLRPVETRGNACCFFWPEASRGIALNATGQSPGYFLSCKTLAKGSQSRTFSCGSRSSGLNPSLNAANSTQMANFDISCSHYCCTRCVTVIRDLYRRSARHSMVVLGVALGRFAPLSGYFVRCSSRGQGL